MASMHAVRSVLLLKYILEEPSGATRGDFDTVETTLEGSAQPIPGVSGAVVTAVNHAEGHLGMNLDIAAHMLAQ
jgi:hypothetical protein